MAILKPDITYNWNGLKINEYLLTKHNINKIDMPTIAMVNPIGITIHNTGAISVSSNTTMAEQYTRATVNGNMKDVRVHFYVDDVCAWQNLPLSLSGWHAADGSGNGNRRTISIEIIGNSKKAEDNAAKLVAYLLDQNNWNVNNNLYTHTHWLNVRDGKKGTIDELNTMKNNYKMCPIYILPHWNDFKQLVSNKQRNNRPQPNPTSALYRVRKTWEDAKSQIGAFADLNNAKVACKPGYKVFNNSGVEVYSIAQNTANTTQPTVKPVTPTIEKINVKYRAYSNGKWWGEITNYNEVNSNGYAGIENKSIKGIAIKVDKGTIKYRVHIKGGGWLGWMSNYNINDWRNGCAGNKIGDIDAVQIDFNGVSGYKVRYRVSTISTKSYLNWIEGYNTSNSMGYAGIFGKAIDKIQIEIVKK
jgi:N-acetylmuramoyl-L-alanine amidase CwlA